MGKLFDNPWILIIIVVVILLLFFAPKLPNMARSLGQSFRIIKSEVRESKNDSNSSDQSATGSNAAPSQGGNAAPTGEAPVEGTVINHNNNGNNTGTGTGTPGR